MDDTPILAFSVRSTTSVRGNPAVLLIRCKQAKLEVFVTALDVKGSESVNVRFDKRPYKQESWSYSTDYHALFSKSPKLLLKEIMRSSEMLLEYQPFVASPAIVKFRLPSFTSHLPELAKACDLDEQFQQELGIVTWYRVSEALSGELVKLDDGSKVQLQCLSSPIKGTPMHEAAREVLKSLTKDHRVRLEYDEETRVLRDAWLAYLFLEDGTDINAELVRLGLATVHPNHGCSRFGELHSLYEEAKEEGRGMWKKRIPQSNR